MPLRQMIVNQSCGVLQMIGKFLYTSKWSHNILVSAWLVIATGDVQATTWIKLCVQCATRFDDPPEESEFLAVLEEFSWKHVGA